MTIDLDGLLDKTLAFFLLEVKITRDLGSFAVKHSYHLEGCIPVYSFVT